MRINEVSFTDMVKLTLKKSDRASKNFKVLSTDQKKKFWQFVATIDAGLNPEGDGGSHEET